MSFDSSDKLEEKLTEYVPVALNSVGGQEEGLSSGIGNTCMHSCHTKQHLHKNNTTYAYITVL